MAYHVIILGNQQTQHWLQMIKLHDSYCSLLGVNPLRPWQNGSHSADETLISIFMYENDINFIKFSLEFGPKGPVINIPAFVQIMAWHQPGNKPLSEPMIVRLPMHICITQPQWVNQWNHVPNHHDRCNRCEIGLIWGFVWYIHHES